MYELSTTARNACKTISCIFHTVKAGKLLQMFKIFFCWFLIPYSSSLTWVRLWSSPVSAAIGGLSLVKKCNTRVQALVCSLSKCLWFRAQFSDTKLNPNTDSLVWLCTMTAVCSMSQEFDCFTPSVYLLLSAQPNVNYFTLYVVY